MGGQLIVIAKDVITQESIETYFREKGCTSIVIKRQRIIPDEKIVIGDDAVTFCGKNILEGTMGAIILDSGYMWPQPVLKPTIEVWGKYRNTLDEYLRNERESFSLWYSLLEILNESLPVCINPQEAFEAESFKPFAFQRLANAGIPIPPIISGNDEEKIVEFTEKNQGKDFLLIPLSEEETPFWIEKHDIQKLGLKRAPVMMQALPGKDVSTIIAVKGTPVYCNPEWSEMAHLIDYLPTIQEILHMPFAELTFRGSKQPVLSDFSASPCFGRLSRSVITSIMNALWEVIKEQKC